jgi:hypothetical protein
MLGPSVTVKAEDGQRPSRASLLIGTTAPPARKAIELLEHLGVLRETTGKQRDRVYAYHAYLDLLTDPAFPIHIEKSGP